MKVNQGDKIVIIGKDYRPLEVQSISPKGNIVLRGHSYYAPQMLRMYDEEKSRKIQELKAEIASLNRTIWEIIKTLEAVET